MIISLRWRIITWEATVNDSPWETVLHGDQVSAGLHGSGVWRILWDTGNVWYFDSGINNIVLAL